VRTRMCSAGGARAATSLKRVMDSPSWVALLVHRHDGNGSHTRAEAVAAAAEEAVTEAVASSGRGGNKSRSSSTHHGPRSTEWLVHVEPINDHCVYVHGGKHLFIR
jgi:hypothetical protein